LPSVSSHDTDERHAIAPLEIVGNGATALQEIREILLSMPRSKVIETVGRYLHATQTSQLLRYTDDIEFLIDVENSQIQVRSCSPVGYYDFGVNRQRMEQIRQAMGPN